MKIRTLTFRRKRDNRISTEHADYYLVEVKPDKYQTPHGDRNLTLEAAGVALQREFDDAANSLQSKYETEREKYWEVTGVTGVTAVASVASEDPT